MSVTIKKLYQSTFLAAAIVSLSACSSTPHIPGMDMVVDGLHTVTDKTVELSSNVWEGTKDVLNIGPQRNGDFLDEVDTALMQPDAPNLLNEEGVVVSGVETFDPNAPLLPMSENELAVQSPAAAQPAIQPLDANSDVIVADNGFQAQELPAIQPVETVEAVASAELIHEVSKSETLWDIAKSTTGDANNWHVLADINNLMPNASVYPGQKLTIPADMVKPGYLDSIDDAVTEQTVVALKVPSKKPVANVEQVAAAEPKAITDDAAFAASMADDSTHMEVGPNESLWDFSKRTTGDATNWKLLAKVNNFSESQTTAVWPGQKILVPTDMIVERDANGVIIAKNAMGGSIPATTNDQLQAGEVVAVIEELPADAAAAIDATAADATAAVLAGTNQPQDGDIKIVEAAFQGDANIKPVTEEQLAEEAVLAANANGGLGTVMIKGTYYPKGVYNKADFEGGLLMRVSPGTELVVSKAIGPWLEVQTDKGIGYVHNRDVK